MSGPPAHDLHVGYEALRAAATGSAACDAPRGWALLCAQGVPAWMRAWAPLPPARPAVAAGERPQTSGLGGEVVRVLTEMALGCRTRLAVS
jgi:hypothetical protein